MMRYNQELSKLLNKIKLNKARLYEIRLDENRININKISLDLTESEQGLDKI